MPMATSRHAIPSIFFDMSVLAPKNSAIIAVTAGTVATTVTGTELLQLPARNNVGKLDYGTSDNPEVWRKSKIELLAMLDDMEDDSEETGPDDLGADITPSE